MTAEASQRGETGPARLAYERSDVAPKMAWLTLGAVVGTLALTCLGVAGLFGAFGSLRQASPSLPIATSAPMLQTNESRDRAVIERRSSDRLRGNGGGLSIEAAMRRTAAAGWDSAP